MEILGLKLSPDVGHPEGLSGLIEFIQAYTGVAPQDRSRLFHFTFFLIHLSQIALSCNYITSAVEKASLHKRRLSREQHTKSE